MPYLGATTVERIIGGSGTPNDFAKIILSMLNALMSIHDKGIIHGDVKENNMLHSLSQNKTVFVDFEFSYYLTDRAASIDPTGVLWAPERRVSERPPKPHTSQDVYSFADMLRRIIGSHRQGVYFSRFFPSLCIFINKALDFTPGNRPQLSSLHTALSEELNQFEIKSNASRFPTEFDEAAYQALEL